MKSAIAARGAATTLGGQILKYLVQLAALVFLARLLSPDDYGVVAMVSAVVGIAMIIGDFGLGLSAVQASDLTAGQRDNLFWVNTLIGTLAAAAVFASGPFLANFYDQPVLQEIASVLSVNFVLNGLASQFRAELVREMKFLALASVDLAAQTLSFGAAILLAILGFGFWSLVAQQVAFALITLTGLIIKSAWSPGLPKRRVRMRTLYSFGASTFATQIINYISSNADSVALGRHFGSAEVGIYNRAFQIFSLPLQQLAAPLTRVALPVLSRLQGTNDFFRYVERMQLVLSYSLLGMLTLVASTAAPLLEVVLGKQWVPGAPILEALCLGGVFQALGYIYYWMFLSCARMNTLLICEGVGRSIMIVLIIVAAPYGGMWVALAVSTGLFLTWLMTTVFGVRRLGLSSSKLVRIAAMPAAIFSFAYAACKVLQTTAVIHQMNPLNQLMALAATCLACLLFSLLLRKVRTDLNKVVATARLAVKRS